MSMVTCHCGTPVDTDFDEDALDVYGACECRACRQARMDHMWFVIKEDMAEGRF